MAKLTKKQFEDVFREEFLPRVIERFEQDGIPDKPARREAWNNAIDGYIQDRMLPEAAGNWTHPSWLETGYRSRGSSGNRHATKKKPTYIVHGHIERRGGNKEAFWTRTGLSKSAADKLAREQRAEAGGVARIVAENGGSRHHATKKSSYEDDMAALEKKHAGIARGGSLRAGHAPGVPAIARKTMWDPTTKKSPAQLDREIAEALKKPANGNIAGIADQLTSRDREALAWALGVREWRHGPRPTAELTRLIHLGLVEVTDKTWGEVEVTTLGRAVWDRIPKGARPRGRGISTKATSGGRRSHATMQKQPEMTVREINALVRAADGRNVYLIRNRLGDQTVQRVVRARTKGRQTEVRTLITGNWLGVLPELGDRLEVR